MARSALEDAPMRAHDYSKWRVIFKRTRPILFFSSPLTLSAGLLPIERVGQYFSFNFDSIAIKILHNLEQTFLSLADARCDD